MPKLLAFEALNDFWRRLIFDFFEVLAVDAEAMRDETFLLPFGSKCYFDISTWFLCPFFVKPVNVLWAQHTCAELLIDLVIGNTGRDVQDGTNKPSCRYARPHVRKKRYITITKATDGKRPTIINCNPDGKALILIEWIADEFGRQTI